MQESGVVCVPCYEAEGNSGNVTVVAHLVLLATMSRLAETFEPGDGCGVAAAGSAPLASGQVLVLYFHRKLVSDEPADGHHLQSVPWLPDGEPP